MGSIVPESLVPTQVTGRRSLGAPVGWDSVPPKPFVDHSAGWDYVPAYGSGSMGAR